MNNRLAHIGLSCFLTNPLPTEPRQERKIFLKRRIGRFTDAPKQSISVNRCITDTPDRFQRTLKRRIGSMIEYRSVFIVEKAQETLKRSKLENIEERIKRQL